MARFRRRVARKSKRRPFKGRKRVLKKTFRKKRIVRRRAVKRFKRRVGWGDQVLHFRPDIVRFKNVVESSVQWTLNAQNLYAQPVRVVVDSAWMPKSGTNPVAENKFNSFYYKKLVKHTYKITNVRAFVDTTDRVPGATISGVTYPPTTGFAQRQMPKINIRYYKMQTAAVTSPPDFAAEERYVTKTMYPGKQNLLWNKVPIPVKQCSWTTSAYATINPATAVSYSTAYLSTVQTTNYSGGPTNTNNVYCPDIYMMPDMDLGPSYFGGNNTKEVAVLVSYDVIHYTTWRLWKSALATA